MFIACIKNRESDFAIDRIYALQKSLEQGDLSVDQIHALQKDLEEGGLSIELIKGNGLYNNKEIRILQESFEQGLLASSNNTILPNIIDGLNHGRKYTRELVLETIECYNKKYGTYS